MLELDPKELRAAFGSYMTGVTVVTAQAPDGTHVGFTANSFTSVSLDPPLLLVCPGQHLSSFEVFKNAKHFAVNILAENQEAVSNRFASSKGNRFAGIKWHADAFGSPIIDGTAAHFSCSTFQQIYAGDHIILIGQVEAFGNNPIKGLGYASSGYFNLNQQLKVAEEHTDNNRFYAGALIECDNHVLVQEVDGKLKLPIVELKDRYRAPLTLGEYLNECACPVDVRQTYSVFDNKNTREHYTYFRATAGSMNGGKAGKFVPITNLNPEDMSQPGVASLMQRFLSEFNNQNFGLFIGNTETGDVSPTQ